MKVEGYDGKGIYFYTSSSREFHVDARITVQERKLGRPGEAQVCGNVIITWRKATSGNVSRSSTSFSGGLNEVEFIKRNFAADF